MDTKLILLSILGRDIKLNLNTDDGVISDLEALKFAFQDEMQRDELLKRQVGCGDVCFKKYDSLFKKNADIRDTDEIIHGETVYGYVVKTFDIDIADGISFENQDPPLIEAQPPENNSQDPLNSVYAEANGGGSIMEKTDEGLGSTAQVSQSPTASTSVTTAPAASIPFPAVLPKFSFKIASAIQKNQLDKHYLQFVRECAHGLIEIVPKPTKKDYDNFSKTVAVRFPTIKDEDGSMHTFKQQLTKVIRNHRTRSIKRDHMFSAQMSSTKKQRVVNLVDLSANADGLQQPDDSIKELKKTFKNAQSLSKRDKEHVSLLHQQSFAARRTLVTAMTSERETYEDVYGDVVKDYPQLGFSHWLLEELDLMTSTNRCSRKANMEALIIALKTHLGKDAPGDAPADTPQAQLQILKRIYQSLCRDGKERVIPPIKLEKVGDIIDLQCDKMQSPFIKVYCSEEGGIAAAYCIAGNGYRCKLDAIDEIEVTHVVELLLAVYFCFNIGFPSKFLNFFVLLQEKVLAVPYDYIAPKKRAVKLANLLRDISRK